MIKTCAACTKLEERVKALEAAVAVLNRPKPSDLIGPGVWEHVHEGVESVALTEEEIAAIQRDLEEAVGADGQLLEWPWLPPR